LTDKQRRFADEYLIDRNATRAYKAAYPSVKSDHTAGAAAARLLGIVSVAAYVREREEQLQESCGITQQMVVDGIREIAFNEDEDGKTRLRAWELLGKHIGMFNPRKDKLDRQEQEARIAKLRADTRTQETMEEKAVVVRFVGTGGAEK